MNAKEFAESIGARCVLPTKPLLQRKDGEAARYFTHTDVRETFERLKQQPAQTKPRRVK